MYARHLLIASVLGLLAHGALAQEPDRKPEFFAKLYAKTCMKHFGKPDGLRNELTENKLPELPPQKAQAFLAGAPGTAWLIPNPVGDFVVSLRNDNVCAVFARRAEATEVERRFSDLVSKSPPPLVSEKLRDDRSNSANGATHTISYAWFRPQAKQKLLFTLTTATSPSAQLQAMASLAMVAE